MNHRFVLRRFLIFLAMLAAFSSALPARPAAAQTADARAFARAMWQAMGGKALQNLHAVRLRGIGRRNLLEQSVRPEGPWLVDAYTFDDTVDLDARMMHRTYASRGYTSGTWFDQVVPDESTVIFNGGVAQRALGGQTSLNRSDAQDIEEELALGPFRIAQTALAAPDLHFAPARVVNGFRQPVLAFTWNSIPVEVVVNETMHLPVEADFTRTRPFDVFWNVWGDVAERFRYESYNEEPGGLHLPRETDMERNGLPDTQRIITSMQAAPLAASDTFALDAAVRTAGQSPPRRIDDIAFSGAKAMEIAPGVFLVPGAWNVSFVVQNDGIVLIEAPLSAPYVEQALSFAATRWPSLPVKAVVTTSDSWPHVGGMRTAVAHGLPIYGPALNRPLIERLVAARHELTPDALARAPRAMEYHDVAASVSLGTGANALRLIPFATPTGERQMMVYFAGPKLLYTSDLFQRDEHGWFTSHNVGECVSAVHREHLAVASAYGMHYAPTPWQQLATASANVIF